MKKIYGYETAIGDSGAKAGGELGVEGKDFQLNVHVAFPVEKVVAPALKAADKMLDGLEKIIPGDWDNAHIEKLKVQFKEILLDLITEELKAGDKNLVAEVVPAIDTPEVPAGAEKSEG